MTDSIQGERRLKRYDRSDERDQLDSDRSRRVRARLSGHLPVGSWRSRTVPPGSCTAIPTIRSPAARSAPRLIIISSASTTPIAFSIPLKRVGPKGEGRFARVTWDEALTDIASRWKAIVEESGAEAILPYSSAGRAGAHSAGVHRRAPVRVDGVQRARSQHLRRGRVRRPHVHDRNRDRNRSGGGRPQPVRRAVGDEHDRHEPPLLALRARGAAARREDRRGRSGPDADRRSGRLAPPDQAGHRRGRWRSR